MAKITGCSRDYVDTSGVTMRQEINKCSTCRAYGSIECENWLMSMGFTPFINEYYDNNGQLVKSGYFTHRVIPLGNQKRIIENYDPWEYSDLDREIDKFLLDHGFASMVCNLPGAETG